MVKSMLINLSSTETLQLAIECKRYAEKVVADTAKPAWYWRAEALATAAGAWELADECNRLATSCTGQPHRFSIRDAGLLGGAGGGDVYHRYSKSETGSQDVPWQMLARREEDVWGGYGDKHFVADGKGATPAESLKTEIAEALDRHPEILDDLQSSGDKLAAEATPSRIVDSAGVWDNPAATQVIYDEVLAPRGITKVSTPDGLIVFDPTHVHRAK